MQYKGFTPILPAHPLFAKKKKTLLLISSRREFHKRHKGFSYTCSSPVKAEKWKQECDAFSYPDIVHGSWHPSATISSSLQALASTAGWETELCSQFPSSSSPVLSRSCLLQHLHYWFHLDIKAARIFSLINLTHCKSILNTVCRVRHSAQWKWASC